MVLIMPAIMIDMIITMKMINLINMTMMIMIIMILMMMTMWIPLWNLQGITFDPNLLDQLGRCVRGHLAV